MPHSPLAAFATRPPVRRAGAALVLLLAGAAGGAGATALTRPGVQMAPTVPTPIARLADHAGIVSVRGQVTDRFGDRFLLQDATGHVLVDAGPNPVRIASGGLLTVQGRFDRGELHAHFLVDASDRVEEVAPPPPPPPPAAAPPAPPRVRPLPPAPPAQSDAPPVGAPPPPPQAAQAPGPA